MSKGNWTSETKIVLQFFSVTALKKEEDLKTK